MFSDRLRNITFAISILFHLILVYLAPGLGDLHPNMQTKWVEVNLISKEFPEQLKTNYAQYSKSGSSKPTDTAESPKGKSPLFPAPPLHLPTRLEPFNDDLPSNSTLRLPGAILPDIMGKGSTSPGLPTGQLLKTKEMTTNAAGIPPELDWEPSEQSVIAPTQIDSIEFFIEGPVSKRKVVYRPPTPDITVSVSGNVKLKFWVHPDGTISKVIPLVLADAELEEAAIEFLKKWRFEAIPESEKDQWGILPVRFRLK